ncbi:MULTISPECIES: cation diffusion facilitator family transporter [Bacillus]|uniref:cation diffusion facilitator family transporter n=1 Tax=Bacillus TaxID=1386 RepID=UPI00057C069B|nr:cation diffusion facilitator family transporter [Bacillus sp. MSP13]
MGHNHTHGSNKKVLAISFALITGYMMIEAIGGFLTNSLALLSDAGHMLSDSISLLVALIAFTLAERDATHDKTFGYKRFEILAAMINGVALILIALYIIYEAIERLSNPPKVATTGMLIISIIGLVVNLLVAWIMLSGGDTKNNLNIKGAFLHVVSDMLGSVGAILAAILIIFFGWGWADPLASVIVAILVLRSGYKVSKDSIHILMEGTPQNIDVTDIILTIEETEGIQGIHDLHIWSITSGLNALSCHAVVDDQLTITESEGILRKLEQKLDQKGITHVTIQMETATHDHEKTILCQSKNEQTQEHHHH